MAEIFLVTRPRAQALKTAEKLAEIGIKSLIEPCFRIKFLKLDKPLFANNNPIIIVSSLNGARAFYESCNNKNLRIITVGGKAADFLREKGFKNIIYSTKNMDGLVDYIKSAFVPKNDEFIYIRGRHVKINLKAALPDFRVNEVIVYEAVARTEISEKTAKLLAEGKISAVLFYSRRTVEIFGQLAQKAGITKFLDKTQVFCLSPEIAEGCGKIPYKKINIAESPIEKSLFKLIQKICR